MAERYQEVYRIPESLFIEESPVIIETSVLFKDTVTNKVLVLAKIRNITDKKIVACKISIRSFEPNGTELESRPEFAYLDIAAGLGQEFGAKVPIFLPDVRTRRIIIAVTEVVFDDGSVWTREACEWKQIPKQETVDEYFSNPSLREQYEHEVGPNCKFVPIIWNGLFLCACGTANLSTAASCYNCQRKYEILKSKIEYEYLAAQSEKREAEKIAAEEAERYADKKLRRRVGMALSVAVAATVLVILACTVIIPAIESAVAYKKAMKLFQEESYDQACAAFESLGDYEDSSEMALESKYQQAKVFAQNQQHEEAIELWTQLGNYLDSQQCIETERKEMDYQEALELMQQEKYISAAQVFEKLGDFKDSVELSKKCRELKIEAGQNENVSQREIDEQNSKKYFAKAGER